MKNQSTEQGLPKSFQDLKKSKSQKTEPRNQPSNQIEGQKSQFDPNMFFGGKKPATGQPNTAQPAQPQQAKSDKSFFANMWDGVLSGTQSTLGNMAKGLSEIVDVTATTPLGVPNNPMVKGQPKLGDYSKLKKDRRAGEIGSFTPDLDQFAEKKLQRAEDIIKERNADPESWGFMAGSLVPQGVGIAGAVGVGAFNPPAGMALGLANTGALTTMAVGAAAEEYDNYVKEKGIEYDPNARLGAMTLSAAVESASEAIPVAKFIPKGFRGKMAKYIFGDTEVTSKLGKELLEEFANTNASRKQLVENVLRETAEGALTEGPTEGVAELGNEFSSWLYKEKEDRSTWQEILENSLKATAGGSMLGGAIGPMSYGAQQVQNRRRRRESGKVILAQDKNTGEAVEIMGMANAGKDGAPPQNEAIKYQAIRPNGKIYEVDENQLDGILEIPEPMFNGLLKGKGKASAEQLSQIEQQKQAQIQQESNAIRQQYEPMVFQGADGNQLISAATFNGEQVFVTSILPDGSAVIQKPGEEKKVVPANSLTEQETLPFEEFMQTFALAPAQITPTDTLNPIQKGEEINVNGQSYVVTGFDAESGIVQLENTEDGADFQTITQQEFETYRQPQQQAQADGEGAEQLRRIFQGENLPEEGLAAGDEVKWNLGDQNQQQAGETGQNQAKTREITVGRNQKVQVEEDANGNRRVLSDQKMTKEEATSLQKSIAKKYPKLNFQVKDNTPVDDDFAEQDWVLVQENQKNNLPDAKYTRNGEELTREQAQQAIDNGLIEGLSIENDNQLQARLKEAETSAKTPEAQQYLGGNEVNGLWELLDRYNNGEANLRPSVELLANKVGYGLTTQGGKLAPINTKSGQLITKPTTNESNNQQGQQGSQDGAGAKRPTNEALPQEPGDQGADGEVSVDASEFRPNDGETLDQAISRVEKALNVKNPYPKEVLQEAFEVFNFQGATSKSINDWVKNKLNQPQQPTNNEVRETKQKPEDGQQNVQNQKDQANKQRQEEGSQDLGAGVKISQAKNEAEKAQRKQGLIDQIEKLGPDMLTSMGIKMKPGRRKAEFFEDMKSDNPSQEAQEALAVLDEIAQIGLVPYEVIPGAGYDTIHIDDFLGINQTEAATASDQQIIDELLEPFTDENGKVTIDPNNIPDFISGILTEEEAQELNNILSYENSINNDEQKSDALRPSGQDRTGTENESGDSTGQAEQNQGQNDRPGRTRTTGVSGDGQKPTGARTGSQSQSKPDTAEGAGNDSGKPDVKERLSAKEQKAKDELKDLWNQFGSGGKLRTGVTGEDFEIAGKIIAKSAELGMVKFEQMIQWAKENLGSEALRSKYDSFRAAYVARIAINNAENEDLNAIANMSVDSFLEENTTVEETKPIEEEQIQKPKFEKQNPPQLDLFGNEITSNPSGQPRKNLKTLEDQAKSSESEVKSIKDRERAAKQLEVIDGLLSDVDEELKLAGYYNAKEKSDETETPHKEHEKLFKRDLVKFSKELAKALGYQHDTDKKGKTVYATTNVAPAGGEGTIILWAPDSEYGVYISVSVNPDYESDSGFTDPLKIEGALGNWGFGNGDNAIMWRITSKDKKYVGYANQWADSKTTIGQFKKLIEKEIKGYLKPNKPKTAGDLVKAVEKPTVPIEDARKPQVQVKRTKDIKDLENLLGDIANAPIGWYQTSGEFGDAFMRFAVEKQLPYEGEMLQGMGYDYTGAFKLILEQNYLQNGDLMSDPRIDLMVVPAEGVIYPLNYTQHGLGIYQEFVQDGKIVNVKAKRDAKNFVFKDWLPNLLSQGRAINPNANLDYYQDGKQGQGSDGRIRTSPEESTSGKQAGTVSGNETGRQTAEIPFGQAGGSKQTGSDASGTGLRSDNSGRDGQRTTDGDNRETRSELEQRNQQRKKNEANFLIPEGFTYPDTFKKASRWDDNIKAIELITKLIEEDRTNVTAEEKEILFGYSGFGGIPEVARSTVSYMKWDSDAMRQRAIKTKELADKIDPDGSLGVFDSIKSTVNTAHYTEPELIRSHYDILQKMGFQSGKILDPSSGIGNYFGSMPESMAKNSNLNGVEIDYLSSQILKRLYPGSKIINSGLQNARIPENSFDLVVSNIPFGPAKVYDPDWKGKKAPIYRSAQSKIHNYFVVKMIESAREGGLISILTSNAVLDTPSNQNIRKYMNEQTEFIGAVRLPNTAFKGASGTQVVTDIIFLRKRPAGEQIDQKYPFLESVEKKQDGATFSINEYFEKNPSHILGNIKGGGQYDAEAGYTVDPIEGGKPLREQINDIMGKFAQEVEYLPVSKQDELEKGKITAAYDGEGQIRSGNVFEKNGKFFQALNKNDKGEFEGDEINVFAKYKAPFRGYIGIRTSLNNLINQERNGADDQVLDPIRKELKKNYDSFVRKHGRLNEFRNVFSKDIDSFQVLALETFDPKGNFKGLADIFTKRTINIQPRKLKTDSPQEAILISLNEFNRINPARMQELLGENWLEKSKELLFELPDGTFESRDQYLSGNIAEKIDQVEGIKGFERNVEELKKVLPEPLPISLIRVPLGARYVDVDVYNDFLAKEVGRAKVSFKEYSDSYDVEYAFSQTYKTGRADAKRIIEAAFSDRTIRINDTIKNGDGTTTTVYNAVASQEANAAVDKLKAKWQEWLQMNPSVSDQIAATYNRLFNSTVKRQFDGKYMTFPGLVGVQLRPHQADAINMIVQNNGGVVDHIVGAGKTFVMVAGAMELKRLGVAKKPLIIGKKSTIPQIAESFQKVYPGAKILAPSDKDFSSQNRKKVLSQIAVNDWDAIILTHENFSAIQPDPESAKAVFEEEIEMLEMTLEEARGDKANWSNKQIKGMEKRKENLEASIAKLADQAKDMEIMDFGKLGIDHIMVDESQTFKNLTYTTIHQNVAGLGSKEGSQRAFNLLMASRTLQKIHKGDKGTTFLSGTPISNSMVELYLILKYLRPNRLRELGLNTFDSWAKTFAEKSSEMEFGVSGSLKDKERFRRFINVPELAGLYTEIADIRNDKNLKLPKPTTKGGKEDFVLLKPSKDLEQFYKKLIHFATTGDADVMDIPGLGGNIKMAEGRMLKVTELANKAAMDLRLIYPNAPFDPNSKIGKTVSEVGRIYEETNEHKGVQLIFLDSGKSSKYTNFETEKELKNMLVDQFGIPANEIELMVNHNTDKKKEILFPKVNKGQVRVLIGSTETMGTGVNVQERVVAMHHVDIPWRPSDYEQRNGRGLRQGNIIARDFYNNEVDIKVYGVERSLDAYRFELLAIKQSFIDQIKEGATGNRIVDEGDSDEESGASFSDFMAAATGNPIIKEKAKNDKLIDKLETSRSAYFNRVGRAKQGLKTSPTLIEDYKAQNQELLKWVERANQDNIEEDYPLLVNGKEFEKVTDAGQELLKSKRHTSNNVRIMMRGGEQLKPQATAGKWELFTFNEVNADGSVNPKFTIGYRLDSGKLDFIPETYALSDSAVFAANSIKTFVKNAKKKRITNQNLIKDEEERLSEFQKVAQEKWADEEAYNKALEDQKRIAQEVEEMNKAAAEKSGKDDAIFRPMFSDSASPDSPRFMVQQYRHTLPNGKTYRVANIPDMKLQYVPVEVDQNGNYREISEDLYNAAKEYAEIRRSIFYEGQLFNHEAKIQEAKERYENALKADNAIPEKAWGGTIRRNRATGTISNLRSTAPETMFSRPTTASDLNRLLSGERAQELIEAPQGGKPTKKAADIAKKAAEFTKSWKSAPEIITYNNSQEVYDRYPELRSQYSVEDLNDVPAIFIKNPDTGNHEAVLIASHSYLSQNGGVERALLHEIIGHYGVREFLKQQAKGEKAKYMQAYSDLMTEVFEAKKGESMMEDIASRYFRKPVSSLGSQQRLIVADEYIAHLAQSGIKDSWIDRIVAKLRQILRQLGIKVGLNDAEIRNIIGNSMRIVQSPNGSTMLRQNASGEAMNMLQQNMNAQLIDGFYSPIEQRILDFKQPKASATKWKEIVGKKDEAQWTGIYQYLDGLKPDQQVTKQELLDWMKENRVQIEIKEKGGIAKKITQNDINEGRYEIQETAENGSFSWKLVDKEGIIYADLMDFEVGDIDRIDEILIGRANRNFKNEVGNTKYHQYQLEGDKTDYKEVLVTLPVKRKDTIRPQIQKIAANDPEWQAWLEKTRGKELTPELIAERDRIVSKPEYKRLQDQTEKLFKSSHFDEPNILVHLRMNTRTDADGNKVLFLEEIQSDWGQKGKREGFENNLITEHNHLIEQVLKLERMNASEIKNQYEDKIDEYFTEIKYLKAKAKSIENKIPSQYERSFNGFINNKSTPSAPFVTDTNSWVKLGLKVALQEAAKIGADKIAWTTGTQQNERYDLSKQVDEIKSYKNPKHEKFEITVIDIQGNTTKKRLKESELEGFLGKELAEKIIKDAPKPNLENILESDQEYQRLVKIRENFAKSNDEKWLEAADNVKDYVSKKYPEYQAKTSTYSGLDLQVGGTGMKAFYGDPSLDISGFDVYKKAIKSGSENNESLEDYESQITNTTYNLIDVSIDQLLKKDADLREFIENEQIDQKNRKIETPIIIGDSNNYSGLKDTVIDGYHRIAQSLSNGEKVIKAYVPVNSSFNNRENIGIVGRVMESIVGKGSVGTTGITFKKELINQASGDFVGIDNLSEEAQALTERFDPEIGSGEGMSIEEYVSEMDKLGYIVDYDLGGAISSIVEKKSNLSQQPSITLTPQIVDMVQGGLPMFMRQQNDQTNTPEFKKWFGDSKVVDENGEPLVVYHGTDKDFNEFTPGRVGNMYFSEDPEYAQAYGKSIIPVFIKSEKIADLTDTNSKGYKEAVKMFNESGGWASFNEDVMEDRESSDFDPTTDETWELIDNPVVVERLKKAGFDGIKMNESLNDMAFVTYAVFSPTQIKSATSNQGTFDPNNADIRFMKTGATNQDFSQINTKNYSDAELSWFQQNVTERFQDKMVRGKRLIEARTGGNVSDESDFYTQENLASSKALEKSRVFEKDYWNPLIETAKKISKATGLKSEDISSYLQFKHHGERKAYFMEQEFADHKARMDAKFMNDPKLAEKYSPQEWEDKILAEFDKKMEKKDERWPTGMTDEEADAGVANFESTVDENLVRELNDQVRKIANYTTQERYNAGLITDQTYQDLMTRYQNYVPLRDWSGMELDNERVYSMLMSAKGRTSKAADPLPFLATAAQEAIVRGQNNLVKQSVLNFVKENVSPGQYFIRNAYYYKTGEVDEFGNEIWNETQLKPTQDQIDSGEAMRSFDPTVHRHVLQQGKRNNVVEVMVDGKKVFIEFKDTKLAQSINNMNQDKMPSGLNWLRRYTRFLSSMYTNYSPEFGVRNLLRDLGFASFNILVDDNTSTLNATMKQMPRSMKTLAQFYNKNDYPKGKDGQLLKEFMESGAVTGYTDLKSVADYFRSAKKEIDKANSQNLFVKGGEGTLKVLKKGLDALEVYNKTLENSMRFSYYKAMREQGLSEQKAAAKAKDLTVNFNRKGKHSSFFGSLYIFFNASVQGTERLFRSFSNPKTRKKSLTYAGMVMAAGMMQSLLYGLFDEEDEDGRTFYEKVPDYLRRSAIILPNLASDKPGEYIAIPMPYGLNIFHAIGESVGRVLTGIAKPEEEALGVLSAATNVYSPLGGFEFQSDQDSFEQAANFMFPTIGKPLLDLAFNRTFSGRPIYREPYTANEYQMPNSQMYFEGVNPWLKDAAIFMNQLTGGDKRTSGTVDINPEWIEYGIEQYLGGPVKFGQNLAATGANIIQGESIMQDPYIKRIPFIRSYLYKSGTDFQARQDFYENRNHVTSVAQLYDGYLEDRNMEKAKQLREEQGNLLKLNQELKQYNTMIRKYNESINALKKQDKKANADKIDQLYEDRDRIMKQFNKRYGEEVYKKRPKTLRSLIEMN